MKKFCLNLTLIFFISSCTSFNYQFDDSQEQGIKIVNNTLTQKTIYLRFLIPGLSEKDSRNSGTKYTLYPGQSKVYFLPEDTLVVATDGPYWDNPNPQKPNEREVLYVEKDIISVVDVNTLLFIVPSIISGDQQIEIDALLDGLHQDAHEDTDEVFIVIEGSMQIEFEDENIELNEGEMYVVPTGKRHRPFAPEEAKIMLVEPKGVVNTGNEINELTAENDQWI